MNVKQLNYSDPKILGMISGSNSVIIYEQLYELIYPDVEKIIVINGGGQADAKDVFQETILDFIENVKLGKYTEKGTLKAYIKKMATYKWYNMNRDGGKLNIAKDKDANNVADDEKSDKEERIKNETYILEEHRLLQECMTELKERPRKLLEFYFYENKSYKEIAKILNYKEKSVKVIANLNKNKLRECVESKQNLNNGIK